MCKKLKIEKVRQLKNEIILAPLTKYKTKETLGHKIVKELEELLEKMCSEYNLVERMLFDMYGNYVLQRALSIATEPYRSVLLELIAPKMESLKSISFGKKLYKGRVQNKKRFCG